MKAKKSSIIYMNFLHTLKTHFSLIFGCILLLHQTIHPCKRSLQQLKVLCFDPTLLWVRETNVQKNWFNLLEVDAHCSARYITWGGTKALCIFIKEIAVKRTTVGDRNVCIRKELVLWLGLAAAIKSSQSTSLLKNTNNMVNK